MSKIRIDVTGVPYHVFSRGNNRQPIFFDEVDRLVFLKYCREARGSFDFSLFAYALMNNHFHLFLQMEKESSLIRLMQNVLFQYSRYVNKKYNRVGHLFQGHYQSLPVETDAYFLTVDRYIHLNPVKAGMAVKPEDFPWSSYRSRFHPLPEDWIDHHMTLDYFGRMRETQLMGYRNFTEEGISKPEEWTLDHLRKMACHGSASFLQRLKNRSVSFALSK